jgi:C-terminal processing protease CtpA/Prc
MEMVEHYKIGAIVGEPTAGINGDIARLPLPVHDIWRYTGMRVDRHDGSPLFGVGVTPTHPVSPTVAGYRQGVDSLLQKALELIKRDTPCR